MPEREDSKISTAAPNVVLKDEVQGRNSIFPRDFLSLAVISSEIGDGNFVDPAAEFRNFGCNFRFETESIFFNGDLGEQFPAERLVARLHIRQVQIRKHIREECENSVSK